MHPQWQCGGSRSCVVATGTMPPCAGGQQGMDTCGLSPETFPHPALLQQGLCWLGLSVPEQPSQLSPACPHQTFPGPASRPQGQDCHCLPWPAQQLPGVGSSQAERGVSAERPTKCSPLRHRPTARSWACHPAAGGARGPPWVGAGGSVPVPTASLDGARRTSC